MRMAVVGAPSYFRPERKGRDHRIRSDTICSNLRLPTHDGLYAWEFERGMRELTVHVDGQLTFNGTAQLLNAALAGLGVAYVPEGAVQTYIAKGRLTRVLADWRPPF
jgi:DNA-binding transcriptional LysR family regulator